MADKELTVFVVDLHPEARPSHDYLFDVLAGKLLKGLKTDYVSVVAYHSSNTEHKLADKGVFPGIEVLIDFKVPSYDLLSLLKKKLVVNDDWDTSQSDSFQSLIFSLSLLEDTKKKAFTRNIVVLTGNRSPLESLTEEKADSIPRLLQNLNVNLVVVVSDLQNGSDGQAKWTLLQPAFTKYVLMSSDEARFVTQNVPPAKKTRPLPIYKGELRFSSNFSSVLEDTSYNAEADDNALAWPVEVYPAAKKESASTSMHDYLVDNGKLVRLERKTSHYVWSKNEEYQRPEYPDEEDVDQKKFDKVEVESKDFTSGFKFSNYDLIALDEDLMDSAKLKIFSSFDILSFIKADSIPQAYLTSETFFVVPEKMASLRTSLNHSAFVKALYDLEVAALTRFVRKQAKEVELGALLPIKVKDGDTFSYNFLLVRLPFKEDEKIGNFPVLSEGRQEVKSEQSTLMEQFIDSRTLKPDLKATGVFANTRVTMRQSDSAKLPLPGADGNDKLLVSAPSQVRFLRYIKTILIKSLEADDLNEFFMQKDFVNNVIRDGSGFTNFFNLNNCLNQDATNTDAWLQKLSSSSKSLSKRLVDELDISFVRKADIKKKKGARAGDAFSTKGNYGADEGDYDEVPDFGF